MKLIFNLLNWVAWLSGNLFYKLRENDALARESTKDVIFWHPGYQLGNLGVQYCHVIYFTQAGHTYCLFCISLFSFKLKAQLEKDENQTVEEKKEN